MNIWKAVVEDNGLNISFHVTSDIDDKNELFKILKEEYNIKSLTFVTHAIHV